jgi:hypothetical protein
MIYGSFIIVQKLSAFSFLTLAGAAKICTGASNLIRTMYRFLAILLLTASAFGQTTLPPTSAGNNPSASPTLNNNDNAQKARAVLDQAIAALGGQAYLTYQNKMEQGRYYALYHGRSDSTGLPYNYYTEYPDRDRFEMLNEKDVHVIPMMIDIGGVKSKKAVVVRIHNGDKGYETTFRGTAAEEPEELAKYLRRRPHSLEWVFRKWTNDPRVALFYDGLAVIDGKATDQITLLNGKNDSVTLFLDQNSHLPLKSSYSWRDVSDKQRNTEEEVYDNYKPVQGIMTPHSVARYYNGDMTQQRFIQDAKYNLNLPASEFDATINYDPKTYDSKHKR